MIELPVIGLMHAHRQGNVADIAEVEFRRHVDEGRIHRAFGGGEHTHLALADAAVILRGVALDQGVIAIVAPGGERVRASRIGLDVGIDRVLEAVPGLQPVDQREQLVRGSNGKTG